MADNTVGRRRRRAAKSCTMCRDRKIKCDRNQPCSNCVDREYDCHFQKHHRTQPLLTPNGTPAVSSLISSVTPQQRRTALGVEQPPTVTPATPATVSSEVAAVRESTVLPFQSDEASLQHILQRVAQLEADQKQVSRTHYPATIAQGLPDTQVIMDKTEIIRIPLGIASEFTHVLAWYGAVTGTSPLLPISTLDAGGPSFNSPETLLLVRNAHQAFQEYKTVLKGIKLNQAASLAAITESRPSMKLPLRYDARKMAECYFNSFEPIYRILHEPSFWTEFDEFWSLGDTCSDSIRFKILLVVAIGSSTETSSGRTEDMRIMAMQWVRSADAWLLAASKKDVLSLSGIQLHCLIILSRQILAINTDSVWASVGSLLHKAMQAGLHRDPKQLPQMPLLRAELRRRLWATVLEIYLQSSLDAEMPPRISVDDFDTESPANIDDQDIDDSTTAFPEYPEQRYTSTSLQIALLELAPVRLRILSLVHAFRSEPRYADVMSLSMELSQAYHRVEAHLETYTGSGFMSLHESLFYSSVCRFFFPLHLPFATIAQSNPEFYYSLKISIDIAKELIRLERQSEPFHHYLCQSDGPLSNTLMAAFTVIGYELLQPPSASAIIQRDQAYLDTLRQTQSRILDLVEDQLKLGGVRIKTHLFLSILQANQEAIHGDLVGLELARVVANAAKNSIQTCLKIIQTHLERQAVLTIDLDTLYANIEAQGYDDDPNDFTLFDWLGADFS
ncbi:hypothetical protein VHEMI07605 [[Torrubiella] hemipterigena]|uniref:Zn(2)-C6 fungal-type domain-containing protein n=1 Tax=[Torrubiella] hemipterigena TaxID=1531966 RepID=A0A0A1TN83_9HYPO|nr:hypothetical protein VHEMI07605 [[Torrubiella] hemipterigena]